MRTWRWYSKVLFGLLVAFAYFVWPTPWRYEHMGTLNALVRVNRLTGKVDVLCAGEGWRSMDQLYGPREK